MGDRLAAVDMGRKVGGLLCPLFGGAGSLSNTMLPGPRPTSLPSGMLVHPAIWPQQTWAKNWGGAGSPSNTMWPGPRPISVPSGILIHSTIWPQYTYVADRRDIQRHSCQRSRFWRNPPAFLTLFRHPNREFQNSAFCSVKYNAEMQAQLNLSTANWNNTTLTLSVSVPYNQPMIGCLVTHLSRGSQSWAGYMGR